MKWSVIKENWKTTKHKLQVMKFMLRTCFKLLRRAWVHDFSKYSKNEAPHFAAAGDTKKLEYNSVDYNKSLKDLEGALDHHYKKNSHHPQHHKNGFRDMQPLDVIEMLCDWKASTLRYKAGDIKDSVKINRERFGYSEDDEKNFEKFFREINAW